MSKKTKEYMKLLRKKTLSSDEGVRLLELADWYTVHKTVMRKKSGTSHQYMKSPNGKYETCIPLNRKNLSDGVRQIIQKLAKGE